LITPACRQAGRAYRMPSQTPSKTNYYLLIGEDEFRKTLALNKLKDKLLKGEPNTFNYCLYYAKSTTAQEVIGSLDTLPLTGENKLVVLKEPELFKDQEKKTLISYLKTQGPTRVFFVMVTSSQSARSNKFKEGLSSLVRVVDFPKLESAQVIPLIIKEFETRKKRINRAQAELINVASGGDLNKAMPLIEQVSIFTANREEVKDEEILQFTDNIFEEVSAFKLLDSLNQNDTDGALNILKRLLHTENNPSKIIGLLGWHIARLLSIKNMLNKNISRSEIASYIKAGTYVINRLVAQAEDFSLKRLRRHLDTLAETDLLLKRSSIKGDFLIEVLIVKLSS